MATATSAILPSRILVVDDERQIHASLRLRLGGTHELEFAFDAASGLERLRATRFDLCLADLHMPRMDGFAFIEAAQQVDPALGFVVLSAFDSPENLRRTIPLQVYDFISKPLPGKADFEARIPEWVARTRQRRVDQELARQAGVVAGEREAALLERDVELVASETARDALRQTAGLLTTVHAQLLASQALLGVPARADPRAAQFSRRLEEARRTAEAAMAVTEAFFDTGYGSRDTSPAVVDEGIRHAGGIALRMCRGEEEGKAVEFTPGAAGLPVRGLSGIDFLLLMAPALGAALAGAPRRTTVVVRAEPLGRLEEVYREPALRNFAWYNRRNAPAGHAAVLITVTGAGPALTRDALEAWLQERHEPLATITARGLVAGVRRCHGALGAAVSPHSGRFSLALALPV